RRLPRRRQLLALTVILVLGAAAAAFWLWWSHRGNHTSPPIVNLTGIDPAVRQAVDSARAAVLANSESADAWGNLGMILLAHGLPDESALVCLSRAEQLDARQPRWPYLYASILLRTDPEAAIGKL